MPNPNYPPYVSSDRTYPLVDLRPIRHIELPFSNIFGLAFELISAVGHYVERIVGVRGYYRRAISSGMRGWGENVYLTVVILSNRSPHASHRIGNEGGLGGHNGPIELVDQSPTYKCYSTLPNLLTGLVELALCDERSEPLR